MENVNEMVLARSGCSWQLVFSIRLFRLDHLSSGCSFLFSVFAPVDKRSSRIAIHTTTKQPISPVVFLVHSYFARGKKRHRVLYSSANPRFSKTIIMYCSEPLRTASAHDPSSSSDISSFSFSGPALSSAPHDPSRPPTASRTVVRCTHPAASREKQKRRHRPASKKSGKMSKRVSRLSLLTVPSSLLLLSQLSLLSLLGTVPPVQAEDAPDRDYYETLGISRSATDAEIKSAYRKLSREYHPDKCDKEKEDECQSKFIEISRANQVLSDAEKRKLYNKGGHEALKEGGRDSFDAEAMFRERFGREPTGKVHVRILQFPGGMQQYQFFEEPEAGPEANVGGVRVFVGVFITTQFLSHDDVQRFPLYHNTYVFPMYTITSSGLDMIGKHNVHYLITGIRLVVARGIILCIL